MKRIYPQTLSRFVIDATAINAPRMSLKSLRDGTPIKQIARTGVDQAGRALLSNEQQFAGTVASTSGSVRAGQAATPTASTRLAY
jgi:hypothetical protein